MEKQSGGGCVFRNQRDEDRVQQDHEQSRHTQLEKLYCKLEEQIEKEKSQSWSH